MGKWSLSQMHLPLKVTWKISRNSSTEKTNFLLSYEADGKKGIGETAFNVRYGESVNSISSSFVVFVNAIKDSKFETFNEFSQFLDGIELPHSLRFGLECAWLDWFSQKTNMTKSKVLNIISPQEIKTSFSIPILEPHEVEDYVEKYSLNRFESIKLKVSGPDSLPLAQKVFQVTNAKIRIDGNEGFKDAEELATFLDHLPADRVEFIEQPLPSSADSEQAKLKGKYSFPFIADESLTNGPVTADLAKSFDGVNLKLMKSGSILHVIEQKKQALDLGLKLMLGCMVETSLAISYGILLGKDITWFDLDGFLLLKEDPYNLVIESNGLLRNKV